MRTALLAAVACTIPACSPVAPSFAPADAAPDAETETGDGSVDDSSEASEANDAGAAPGCPAGSRSGGTSGGTFTTKDGIGILVRVPQGYVATTASPLIMVYSPCCGDAAMLETFTGLTGPATAHGYVIAYADHVADTPLAPILQAAAGIPDVTSRWCIDPKRIYVTGHSDGGAIAEVIGALELANVAAIAPSAAGFSIHGADEVGCRKSPLPVMEMHSSGDTVFPISQGYGAEVAQWWATCDGCNPAAGSPGADGCVAYTGCSDATEVRYCQGTAPHGYWPPRDTSILDFFDRFRAP